MHYLQHRQMKMPTLKGYAKLATPKAAKDATPAKATTSPTKAGGAQPAATLCLFVCSPYV